MKNKPSLRERWQGLTDTVNRFPLTFILLITAVVSGEIAIETQNNLIYFRLFLSFLIGAMAFIVLQLLYERFFDNPLLRLIFVLIAACASIVYYIMIRNSDWDLIVSVRTLVIVFILLISLIWIPVIKNEHNFNESFMAVFKAFFISVFFDGVLYLGVVLIIAATNMLIVRVDSDAYVHAANLIFVLITPIYFLSMLPIYQERGEQEPQDSSTGADTDTKQTALEKMTTPGKFLESLISYVIIPITAVFTIILLLYIILNITGEFWTDNLMEPLLVSYSITVIIVYLLSSTIQNPFARYFRMIFPKVLVPVVLFETISAILKTGEVGITYGRYYAMLFGIFAVVAGLLFCFIPIRKNGIIAPILIILSLLSILPPVDSFTLSKYSQISILRKALEENNMLEGDKITPRRDLPEEVRNDIAKSVSYLDQMGYTDEVDFLSSYHISKNFENTFGFAQYGIGDKELLSYYRSRNNAEPIPVADYDYMIVTNVNNHYEDGNIYQFSVEGAGYQVRVDASNLEQPLLLLEKEDGAELLRYELNDIFDAFLAEGGAKDAVATSEMTFQEENDTALVTIIANSISYNEWNSGSDRTADVYVLINIK